MNEKYDKDILIKLVNESNTFADVLRKLDIRTAGGNFKTLQKWIKYYDIDTKHFCRDYSHLKKFTKIELDEILIENSNYKSTSNLKERLYKEGLKERCCELCGQGEEWHGKKMSLILDHINGVHDDNRLENLRIVCPNCNATLDTHCGKNKAKKNLKKVEYGFNISDKVNFGKIQTKEKLEAQYNHRKIKDRPTIDILKNDIITLGYVGTGRKYGVSDNAIRKWVKLYGLNPKEIK